MFLINKYTLSNGLRIVHTKDRSTQMVALNVLYNVGAKNEAPLKTGFAHLFEHFMFGGSLHIPDYDTPLQLAGGDNNAWTSNDFTNFYLTVPAHNVETGFWLESDRMMGLAFSEQALNVQKQVVCEEFKERNLNQPYGDISLLFRPLAYKTHPYRWSTIGKELSHIESATLEDVKDFYNRWYVPNNAILSVVGNIDFEKTVALAEKWFGEIECSPLPKFEIPQEKPQTEARFLEVERDVPADCIVKGYHICGRTHKDFYVFDLLSDLLSNGNSSRLYQHLVKEKTAFSEVNAYVSGDVDPGLFYLTGKPLPHISLEEADRLLTQELYRLVEEKPLVSEMEKVKNKFEANSVFALMNYLNKAMDLAAYESISSAENIYKEVDFYRDVQTEDVFRVINEYMVPNNCSTLYYRARKTASNTTAF